MKIIVVEPAGKGKLCHYAYGLCQALAARHEVRLITSLGYELKDMPGEFELEECGRFYQLQILRAVLSGRYDVLHFQWSANILLDLTLIRLLKAMSKVRIVYTPHNLLPHRRKWYHFSLYNAVYRTVDRLVVHSEYEREVMRDIFGISSSKIEVLLQGDYLHLPRISRREARKQIGLSEADKVALFFGYISQEKGLGCLIKAFDEVKKKVETSRLIVAGRPAADISVEAEFPSHLRNNGDLILDLRYIPVKKAGLYFSAADVVVLPYTKVCNSPVIQQAYSFGRPVITTQNGQVSAVENGKSGYLVPPDNPQELAGALTRIFGNNTLREEMSAYAHQLALTKYSWDGIAERTEEVYGFGRL